MGYAPDAGAMRQRGWVLTLHCGRCRFQARADIDKIIRERGRAWSPWGRTAKCPALHCSGRMAMKGYDPRSNFTIDI
jgi:hypothetical protein